MRETADTSGHDIEPETASPEPESRARINSPGLSRTVERINALILNARTIWFVLLGVLAFVGITLMSVEHVDFYGLERRTSLPVIGITVSATLFFYLAPVVIAITYCYFHLTLIRLWTALGSAPAKIDGLPLGRVTSPWLVSEAVLYYRCRERSEPCVDTHPLDSVSFFFNLYLAWLAAILLGILVWFSSLPARDAVMSQISAAAILTMILFGARSFLTMHQEMSKRRAPDSAVASMAVILLGACLVLSTFWLTGPTAIMARPVNLSGATLSDRNADWVPRSIALQDFRDLVCRRENRNACISLPMSGVFLEEWELRRSTQISGMQAPDLTGRQLQNGNLRNAFMPGIRLSGTNLNNADLGFSHAEYGDFQGASMRGASLFSANMEKADLREVDMTGAVASFAQLEGAFLIGADLTGASLVNVNLTGASLAEAKIVDADLSNARLENAIFDGALLSGRKTVLPLDGASLRGASFHGAALRNADLANANLSNGSLRNSFLDGSVKLPSTATRNKCQWSKDVLGDQEFFGRWRGWVESFPGRETRKEWADVAPRQWLEVPPLPPPAGCIWLARE